MPPLRVRPADILDLQRWYLKDVCRTTGAALALTPEAERQLQVRRALGGGGGVGGKGGGLLGACVCVCWGEKGGFGRCPLFVICCSAGGQGRVGFASLHDGHRTPLGASKPNSNSKFKFKFKFKNKAYAFPGNVEELFGLVRRAATQSLAGDAAAAAAAAAASAPKAAAGAAKKQQKQQQQQPDQQAQGQQQQQGQQPQQQGQQQAQGLARLQTLAALAAAQPKASSSATKGRALQLDRDVFWVAAKSADR